MTQYNNKIHGFTLIEVLVALIILAIAAFAIVTTSNSNIRTSAHLKDNIIAKIVAANQIARLQTGMSTLPQNVNDLSGSEIQLNKIWYWHLQVTQQGAGESSNYLRVKIEVSKSKNGGAIVHLIGFIPQADNLEQSWWKTKKALP